MFTQLFRVGCSVIKFGYKGHQPYKIKALRTLEPSKKDGEVNI